MLGSSGLACPLTKVGPTALGGRDRGACTLARGEVALQCVQGGFAAQSNSGLADRQDRRTARGRCKPFEGLW